MPAIEVFFVNIIKIHSLRVEYGALAQETKAINLGQVMNIII